MKAARASQGNKLAYMLQLFGHVFKSRNAHHQFGAAHSRIGIGFGNDFIKSEVFAQFVEVVNTLESHYRDMQDIEFTVEQGRLWMLQTRNGKRTAAAAVKTAVDMVEEGLISREEALLRIEPQARRLHELLACTMDTLTPAARQGRLSTAMRDRLSQASGRVREALARLQRSTGPGRAPAHHHLGTVAPGQVFGTCHQQGWLNRCDGCAAAGARAGLGLD